jgi:hypothetical protein
VLNQEQPAPLIMLVCKKVTPLCCEKANIKSSHPPSHVNFMEKESRLALALSVSASFENETL